MKQKNKQEKVKLAYDGKRATVYHVDIPLGKFLVMYYADDDEYEVYWRSGIISVASHTEEYARALSAVDEKI
jgi:hypothetical protein